VAINLFLKEVGAPPLWRHGIEQRSAIEARATDLIRQYDVRTPSARTPAGRLSGGNIQKLILARELAYGAKLIIFNKPTHGLDLANTLAARQWIKDIATAGMGVLLISTDLEELLALSDRIAVMSRGRIAGIINNSGSARTAVGRLMTGLAA
ncbi:MAG TPA: ABC transporter ATP-binding protein, partial [Aestuariivirga sp.]|nr:ABC transporter ATP-binding protein [Aestuariivirga sp.]